jgi:predicted nucleotidyltransferase
MTTISYNISGKLDAHVVEAMERLAVTCSSLGADFLLVGAAARDIHFRHVHGIAPGRANADVGFASATGVAPQPAMWRGEASIQL